VDRQLIERLGHSRRTLTRAAGYPQAVRKGEEEGGCGVVGFCCTKAVPGRHIYEPSRQMHNRGNGKGGGIAAVGLVPEQLGVSRQVLDEHYMLHIALLDPNARAEVEQEFITPHFDVAACAALDKVDDWQAVGDLEVKPPDVWRYFIRVKPQVLDEFVQKNGLGTMDRRATEDEYVSQNSFKLNQKLYASLGRQRAFVLSHGRNIMILKVVGYAEAIVKYYKIEDLCAHVWIAHQRYPTKGRVWHPGGAHPFAAMNMALVHNGDFANYHSVSEYLRQRNIYPQFLTDTEVSALLFDLLDRTYHYPLEYIIEALAPTPELDFDRLAEEKQRLYKAIQTTHIHGSPDGPWFFIIARNVARENKFQLIGITDTAMLRPQVFAFCEGEVQVGLIASEKQAIDATLQSLHREDKRICPVADRYWNARGGSHTDGGAFLFNLSRDEGILPSSGVEGVPPSNRGQDARDTRGRDGHATGGALHMTCTDKFGQPVPVPEWSQSCDFSVDPASLRGDKAVEEKLDGCLRAGSAAGLYEFLRDGVKTWSFDAFRTVCRTLAERGASRENTATLIEALTLLNDRQYPTGGKRRSHILHLVRSELFRLLRSLPKIKTDDPGFGPYRLIDLATRGDLRGPARGETTLVIDALGFPPEGDRCDATLLCDAFLLGWRHFITFDLRGQRFHGCGLGPDTDDVTIDIYGSSGDYLGSGLDGLTITVHGNAQDQLGQIIKRGKLVVHGDVGQTFMYGAKGGNVFVLGNAAGRPLINSVGRPKVVINGTCLDFLAESFMAGDPLTGGGFVILNGIRLDENGQVVPLPEPYPGSNLFSLASGGAIYVRDPHHQVVDQQLNGGKFTALTPADWDLILPFLQENERLFGIKVEDLLTVDGRACQPEQVYRKVTPVALKALAKVAALPGQDKKQAAKT
jgi:glutamate synthase domain-containing protein 1/glutamate synthase domain-containing protein 3